ncbi:MAG: flagellar motor switch protein FliN [Aquificota bacterium]|nr:flagellar motor switch protein FliN [Aquificota bacterium]
MEEERKEEEISQEELAKQWEEALSQQKAGEVKEEAQEGEKEQEEKPPKPSGEDLSKLLERIMDIPLNVEVVVGSAVIQIKDLLGMGPGSVFELDRETTEPVDIKVNGKLIAKGELVVVGEKFGVRITEIYTEERKSVFRDTLEETLKK